MIYELEPDPLVLTTESEKVEAIERLGRYGLWSCGGRMWSPSPSQTDPDARIRREGFRVVGKKEGEL